MRKLNQTALVFLLSLLSIASTLNGAAAADGPGNVRVEENWFDFKMRWTEGPPTYVAKYMVIEFRNEIYLCGAGYFIKNKQQSRDVLRDRGFYIGDQLVFGDVRFFRTVKRRKSLVGIETACKGSGKSPSEFSSHNVSLRKMHPGRRY